MKTKRVIVVLLALAGMLVTGSLGRWQLSRAAEKLALQHAWEQAGALPDAGPELLQALDPRSLYRHVQLRGHWMPEHTVFLDNRSMDQRAGFYVLTPLALAQGRGEVVLVLRGWAPRDFMERARLPDLETPTGEIQLRGQLVARVPAVYALGEESAGVIRQNVDTLAFARERGLSVPDVVVQQVGAASEGLLRHWPEPASGLERHRGYAFQWFGLCALMGALFVWFQMVQIQHASRNRRQQG